MKHLWYWRGKRKGADIMKLQRKDEIIKMVSEDRMVKANELSKYFEVSMETIRRDLEQLEKEGFVRRVHGGAVLNISGGVEPDFSYREISNFEEKLLIGKKASSLVEDGDTIIIDIGTTTLEFARFLKGKEITVFTNSLKIALELMNEEKITVIVTGGVVRKGEGTTSGYWAEDMMDQLWVDKLFLGVGCLDQKTGVMDYHIEETNLRRHYLKHTKQVIALADYTKFGRKALNKVCDVGQINTLVTDEKADKRIVKDLRDKGINVILA